MSSGNVKCSEEDNFSIPPHPSRSEPVVELAQNVKKERPGALGIQGGLVTQRLGNQVQALLEHLCPNPQEPVSSSELLNAIVLPVFVDTQHASEDDPSQYAQHNASGAQLEVIRSPLFFKTALAIVALEAVLQVHSCDNSNVLKKENILVMLSLWRLRDFEGFVNQYFTQGCVEMERSLGLRTATDNIAEQYKVENWLGDNPDADL